MGQSHYERLSPEKKAALIERTTARNKANPERRREVSRSSAERRRAVMDPIQRREKNRIESAARKAQIVAWRKANPEKAMAAAARYQAAHPYGSLPIERKAGYQVRNAARRAVVRQATPRWADRAQMEAFYREAARRFIETGIHHEVDHIVPLNSPLVCGLHVQANLRVITKSENRSKRNRMATA